MRKKSITERYNALIEQNEISLRSEDAEVRKALRMTSWRRR